MKKLIFVFLAFISLCLSGQTEKRDFRTVREIPAYTISTIDTSWTFYLSANYTGLVGVVCSSLTGTLDCEFKMQGSFEGDIWYDLDMREFTPTASDTTRAWHIPWSTGTDFDQVRLFFDRNSTTGGTISINARFNRRK